LETAAIFALTGSYLALIAVAFLALHYSVAVLRRALNVMGSTLYRIHGTNAPWTIGGAVSSGCIRMRNEDVVDLFERVPVGTKVIVI